MEMTQDATYEEQGMRVAPAPHGLGVYALRSFHDEELIGPIDGAPMGPGYDSAYCMEVAGEVMEPVAPFRFLNHSCDPNCALIEMEVDYDDGKTDVVRMWIEVLTEIEPGEEMTIDYNWPAEAAIPCNCGSPVCRGWIVAEEELYRVFPLKG